MRTIETNLWPLEQPAGRIGLGVYLGEEHAPELTDLRESERVVLVEPNELRATATVHQLTLDGRIVWFANIGDRERIEVIYSGPPTDFQDDDHNQDTRTATR